MSEPGSTDELLKILMVNMLQKKAEAKQVTNEPINDSLVVQSISEGHRSIPGNSRPKKISKSSFKRKRTHYKGKTDICEYSPRKLSDFSENFSSPETDTEIEHDEMEHGSVDLYEIDGNTDYDYQNDIYNVYSGAYSTDYNEMAYEIPSRKRRNAEDADYSAPWSVELLDENNSFLCNGILLKNGMIVSLAICHETRIPSHAIIDGRNVDLVPSLIQPDLNISKNGIIGNNLQVFKFSTNQKSSFRPLLHQCIPSGGSRLKDLTGRCFIENKFFENVSISDCSKSLGMGSSKESICLNSNQSNGLNDMCEYSLGTPVACETKRNGFHIIGLISTKILPCNINSQIGLVSIGAHIGWLESVLV